MEKTIIDKYRNVLCSTPQAVEVLTDIMTMCHFGSTLDPANPVQVSEYNVGVAILAKCGVFSDDNRDEVFRALCGIANPAVKSKPPDKRAGRFPLNLRRLFK